MALQFPLRFGKPRWHTSRPTTRMGRAFRAAIGRAAAVAAALPWAKRLELGGIGKKPTPQWVKDAKRRALAFAKKVRGALMSIEFEQEKPAAAMQSGGVMLVGMMRDCAGPGAGLLGFAADKG